MRTICAAMYLTLFAVLLSTASSEVHRSSREDWHYLVFQQRWPISVCLSEKKQKCQIPSFVSSWTVHGIWPSNRHSYPSFCNKSLPFSRTAIEPIEDELLVIWPNLYPDRDKYAFWKHEWLKHGTCAVTLSKLDTELKYFTEAIREHNLYNILKYLEEGGITPDEQTTYSMDRFKTAVESNIGKIAAFQCKKVKDYEAPLILSVSVCMDKDFRLIDCPKEESGCKSSVMYTPLRHTNAQYIYDRPIFYAVIGLILLLVAVIMFTWFFISSKRKTKRKVYTVLI